MHRTRVYGLAGLLGAAVFTASLIVLHLTHTEVDWAQDYVSRFANGPLGWVFASSALVHGVGNLALTLGLRRSLDPGPLRAWAVALFGAAAAGIVVDRKSTRLNSSHLAISALTLALWARRRKRCGLKGRR